MKKLLTGLCLSLFLISCGGTSKTAENEEITEEQEAAIVDSLSTQIDTDREELEAATQENLAEIDSLLENF